MKVRIGYGLGTRTTLHDDRFGHVVDDLERLGFDSLWVSERIGGEAPDPLVAMSYAAGRTQHLKFGMSVMVLPGRNPIVLAKSLATLATMSGGRLLPAFGLGQVHPHQLREQVKVDRGQRVGAAEAVDLARVGRAHHPEQEGVGQALPDLDLGRRCRLGAGGHQRTECAEHAAPAPHRPAAAHSVMPRPAARR